ncbi:MAG: hypothetical protein ACYDHW_07875 [Syntrophorhabdaceae bacterium]
MLVDYGDRLKLQMRIPLVAWVGILVIFLFVPVSSLYSAQLTINEKAVYKPARSFLDEVREKCDKGPDTFDRCFTKMLKKAGANKAVINFNKRVGESCYIREFEKIGPVDAAFAECPFRANENQALFLVNGNPLIVNVDDLSAIKESMLEHDPNYMHLKKKYPDIALWIGDRTRVDVEHIKAGKLRIIVPYRLVKGCRACEDIGIARIAFEFDRAGKFKGRKLIEVRTLHH